MSIRNLDALFAPSTIALVGASNRPGSVGSVLARNLFDTGFAGPILTVNPHERAVRSTLNYHSVAELPLTPDLAVICTPSQSVPSLIGELGARGCRAAVVITAGFGEGEREEGRHLRQEMLDAAKPHLLRIVGPNCLGVMLPHIGVNASFAHLSPLKGNIAFLTQSGAIATTMLDWANSRGVGFSRIVSLGSMSDVDFGDILDHLALDPQTNAILLYIEAVTEARKFLSAARAASRTKPVIVVKAGRSEAGAKAALSHTGALAGSDAVYDAAFRRAGMLRVNNLGELFEAVSTLATGLRLNGERLAILTNGGGVGVLAVDEMADTGSLLAKLSQGTIVRLDSLLPGPWSRSNPVDILGDADGGRYVGALEALFDDPECDAILVMNCPTAVADPLDAAKAVTDSLRSRRKPTLTCWLGEAAAAESRRYFAAARVPSYETPEQAVRAFGHLVRYRRNWELLMQTPPAFGADPPMDRGKAASIIDAVLENDRTLLTEPEAKELLAAYGIPTVRTFTAVEPQEAGRTAEVLGFPVALKILSRDITHKSDVGGVQLDLNSTTAVTKAAQDMIERVRQNAPAARIDGFTVQEMIKRPRAQELILGMVEDSMFGPVILFGQGGTAVEVLADRVVGLPPLNPILAREMIEGTRVFRLLRGYRDRPAADLDMVAFTLVRLSRLVSDLDSIAELDINPLLADAAGVIALDARIVLKPRGTKRCPLAIQPYPRELEQDLETRSGHRYLVRPIRPEDEPSLVDMLHRSSMDDIRMRFFAAMKEFPHAFAARLTQIDYNREMALVAVSAEGEIGGVVHLAADPDNQTAEFAVMVRTDLKGTGLGYALMEKILNYARGRGIRHVVGEVLRENVAMLKVAKDFGFQIQPGSGQSESVSVAVDLAVNS